MDEEKSSVEQPPVRSIRDDMEELKQDINTIKFELSEIRAAFYNMVNEMRLQHRTFTRGMNACHDAFLKCKKGYDSCKEAYEDIGGDMTNVANSISNVGWSMGVGNF